MTLVVTGMGSTIVGALMGLLPEEVSFRLDTSSLDMHNIESSLINNPHTQLRIVLAAGVVRSRSILDQTLNEVADSFLINCANPIKICEMALRTIPTVRICVIGSRSAELGSFDEAYAAAKAGLHAYVKSRRVGPMQQLTCIAPTIIADSRMTYARHDYPEVLERRPHVHAIDVAKLVKRLLYDSPGPPYRTNNCVFPLLCASRAI